MSVTPDVPGHVAALVERLREAGFTEVAEVGSGQVNHLLECRAPDFAVRLTGDRGQWWVDGGLPGGEDWFDADLWRSCREGEPPWGELSPAEDQVDYFVRHHHDLAAAAGDPATRDCLLRQRARRTRERLGLPPA